MRHLSTLPRSGKGISYRVTREDNGGAGDWWYRMSDYHLDFWRVAIQQHWPYPNELL